MKDSVIFRTSALLYADNNYDVKTDRIILKMIESIFVIQKNFYRNYEDIIKLLSQNYSLDFHPNELNEVVLKYSENFDITYRKNEISNFKLTNKRNAYLLEKLEKNDIEIYIDQFIEVSGYEDNVKTIIYSFLHYILNTNLSNFQHMLLSDLTTSEILKENNNFSPDDIDVINKFLRYDNPHKNKAIYDIISYSLEYCLLTGDGKPVYEQGLKNKTIYLDTNILFRAIGINGEFRKMRTISFLQKCRSAGETLVISKYTEDEFKNTISANIDRGIRRFSSNYERRLYFQFSRSQDLFYYYLNWKSGRQNQSADLFESYISSQYQSLLQQFSIQVDYNVLSEEWNSDINELANRIESHKDKVDNEQTDAKNLLLIRSFREKHNSLNKKIMETKYFMISEDGKLMDFAINHFKGETILCMLPSYWHTILLKYSTRTEDDFKSFVSFLQLQNHEKVISSEKIQAVLSGISEITSDIEEQEQFADEIVNRGVNNIIESTDLEYIHEQAARYTESGLARKLEESKKDISDLKDKVDSFETSMAEKDEKLDKVLSAYEQAKSDYENEKLDNQENSQKKEMYKNRIIEDKIKNWKNRWYILIGAIVFIIAFAAFNIIFFPTVLFGAFDAWIRETNSPFINILYTVIIGGSGGAIFKIGKHVSNEDIIDNKRKMISQNLE